MALRISLPQQQDPGFLVGAARNIVNPARKTAGQFYDAFSRSGNFFSNLGARLAGRQPTRQVYDPSDNPFLNTQEQQTLHSGVGNYALQSLKNTAGIASYFIPFGRGAGVLSRGIVPGAVTGGLSGFSNDENLGGIAGSALTGGVTGGVLDKVLRGLSGRTGEKIAETGKNLRKGVMNPQAVDPLRADAPTIEEEIFQEGVKRGLKGSSLNQRKQVDALYRLSRETIAKEIEQNTQPILKSKLINDLGSDVVQNGVGFDINNTAQVNLLNKELSRIENVQKGQAITLKDLFGARTKLSTNLFKTTNEETKTVLSALLEAVDKQINQFAPRIGEETAKQHQLHTLARGITKKSLEKEGFGVRLPILGNRVGLPAQTSQSLQDLVGRGLERVGNSASRPLVSPNLSQILLGSVPRIASNLPDTVPSSTPQTPSPLSTIATTPIAPPQTETTDTNDLTTLLQLGVLSGDISASDVTALQSLGLVPKETTQKETQRQESFNIAKSSAEYALRLLESDQASTGFGTTFAQGLKRSVGINSPQQQDFLSTLSLAKGTLLNALSGAAVTPSEYERFKPLLDIENSDSEIAKQQLRTFIRILEDYQK